VDYGDQVKAGQKIAELEVPELEDELAKAHSATRRVCRMRKRAEADFAQADVIYQRLLAVSKGTPPSSSPNRNWMTRATSALREWRARRGAATCRESQSEVQKTKALFDYTTISAHSRV